VLTLSAPSNLAVIKTDLSELGFDPANLIKLEFVGFGGGPARLVFENVPVPPTQISRDGQAVIEDCGSNAPTWCYDASTGTLTIQETIPAIASWRIIP